MLLHTSAISVLEPEYAVFTNTVGVSYLQYLAGCRSFFGLENVLSKFYVLVSYTTLFWFASYKFIFSSLPMPYIFSFDFSVCHISQLIPSCSANPNQTCFYWQHTVQTWNVRVHIFSIWPAQDLSDFRYRCIFGICLPICWNLVSINPCIHLHPK